MSTGKRRPPLGLVSKVWGFVEEPKSVTLVQALVVYVAAIVGGALTLFYPPRTTSIILGDGLMTIVAVLMIFGGAFGVVTSIIGWWWIERPLAVGVLLIAGAGYTYSVAEAQALTDGNRWLQLSWLVIAGGGLVIRYLRIRRANYDPVN